MKHINRTIFIGILLLAVFFRVWLLWEIPSGVANDEANYLYSAYSIWHTGGYDLQGNFLPLSFNTDTSSSPVPVYFLSPVIGIFGFSLFTGRILYMLVSVGSIVLVYLISKKFTQNTLLALASMGIMALSKWHIIVSRGSWEAVIALFFFLAGIYIFIVTTKKGSILLSLPLFFLAFYSYHATKIFFLFFIPILVFISIHDLRRRKRELLLFIVGYLITIFSFFMVINTQNVTRQETLIFQDSSLLSAATKTVNFQRQKSTAPMLVRQIMHNKVFYIAGEGMRTYMEAYSPQHLFTVGDISLVTAYGNFFKGSMYFFDFILLVAGGIFLIQQKQKRFLIFLIAGLLIAPLPAALGSGRTYVLRGIMMIPFLTILAGCGLYFLITSIKNLNTNLKVSFFIIIFGIYGLFVVQFFYQYFYQFAVFGSEFRLKSSRDLATMIGSKKGNYENIYLVNNNKIFLLQYGLFNNVSPHIIQQAWKNNFPIQIDNITISEACLNNGEGNPIQFLKHKSLYITNNVCHVHSKPSLSLVDSLEPLEVKWKVYEKK